MTGIPLPGGVTLYGEGDTPDVCGAPGGQGITLPGNVTLYGLGVCQPLPDLLAGFSWLADAKYDRANRMTDQINGTTAVGGATQPKNTGGYAFDGTALIGQMALTAGTNTGDWFTDLDFSWDGGVMEHVAVDTSGGHNIWQILYVPAVDTSIAWLEVSFEPQANGDVLIFLDAGGDGNAGADRFSWLSTTKVGNWNHQGVTIYPGRLTCADGECTLYTSGVEIDSGTVTGPGVFLEPPDNSTVWAAGSNAGAFPIVSFTLLDGIDGDPIITFDADAPTGWTEVTGNPTTAPTTSAYVGLNGYPFTFPSAATYNLPAATSVTLVVSMRAIATQTGWVGRNIAGMFGGQAGWVFLNLAGFSIPWSFRVSDSSVTATVDFGTVDFEDHVLVVTIDRDADVLTSYLDGGATDTANIATLGAVAPTAAVAVGAGASWIYAAGAIDRVLTHPEIIQLNDLLL